MESDLNANLADAEGTSRAEAISEKLMMVVLMDMGLHLLPWYKPWLNDRCTSMMQQDGLEVRFQTYYIIGTDRRFFRTWPSGTCETTWTIYGPDLSEGGARK